MTSTNIVQEQDVFFVLDTGGSVDYLIEHQRRYQNKAEAVKDANYCGCGVIRFTVRKSTPSDTEEG